MKSGQWAKQIKKKLKRLLMPGTLFMLYKCLIIVSNALFVSKKIPLGFLPVLYMYSNLL